MVIEILYDKKTDSLYCKHDGRGCSYEEIKFHININGHKREVIGIAVPDMDWMKKAQKIKKELSSIFDKKSNGFY